MSSSSSLLGYCLPGKSPFFRLRHVSKTHLQPRTRTRRRHLSSQPGPSQTPSPTTATAPPPSATSISSNANANASTQQLSRLTRLNARLPKFVQRWTSPLLRAPASQIISFLILHEATAVVPLFGLVGAMHYTSWTPPFAESTWVVAGVEKFGKYARRKGWLADRDVKEAEGLVGEVSDDDISQGGERNSGGDKQEQRRWWQWGTGAVRGAWHKRDTLYKGGETGVRLLVEFGTAWAVVKALLVPRLILSAWATPWFARLAVEPVMRVMARRGGKLVGASKKAS